MIKHILHPYLFLFPIYFISVSCTKDVDFNQINDLEISPIIESSLFYFDATANDFIIGGSDEFNIPTEFIAIDLFNNQFTNDNLIKVELLFEIVNSINRSYRIQVDFLDNSSQLLHTFSFSAEASITNEDLITQKIEIFEGQNLISLKQTRQIAFTLIMLPGVPINASTQGKIYLESKGTFYLNI